MNDPAATLLIPLSRPQHARSHPLDDTWLLTLATLLVAIAVPRAISGMSVDYFPATMGLLALAVIHVAFAWFSRGGEPSSGARRHVLKGLHALGLVTIAFVWQHAGGLQNPALLVAFVIPVIGALFLSRWQPYVMAALAMALVLVVASAQAPELRWHATDPGSAGQWLSRLAGEPAPGAAAPFPGFYAPSGYFVVLLEVFGITMIASAVAAEYLGTLFERTRAQASQHLAEAARSLGLWSTLIEGLPVPALLVDADTRVVLKVSAGVRGSLLPEGSVAIGRDLFEVLHFSYPEPIERLVTGADGVARLCMMRMASRLRATEVRVQHLAQGGRRLALLLVADSTEEFCVRLALDGAEQAALVADDGGRVLAINKAARAVLAGTTVGSTLPHLVAGGEGNARWWDPGLSGRRKLLMTMAARTYQVTASAVSLPGEEARLFVIAFHPASLAAAPDPTAPALTALRGP